MRKTLNKALVTRNRDDVDQGSIPDNIFLEWSAYRQLHDMAVDLGLAGRDDPLHDFLDERLTYFEECAWLSDDEPRKECPECGGRTTPYSLSHKCPVCRKTLIAVN